MVHGRGETLTLQGGPRMPKGVVSAYEAGKFWSISPETVKKWIFHKKIKGYMKDYGDAVIRYYVYESELEPVKKKIKVERESGKPLFEK